jgi:NADH-dependent peroxiredoxin subunit F
MYDLIVVGGGPAGLTSTMYAIRKRLNVLMISRDLGGKTNYRLGLPWIDNYQVISGLEVVNKFKSELEYLKFARHMDTVDSVVKVEEGFIVKPRDGGEMHTKAVIIATGTRQKRLEVPGEREFMMRGLCYSALSYAPLFIDKKTVVVGDGELALRSAGELATVAEQVVLVCSNESELESPLGKKLTQASNVTVLKGHRVEAVQGDDFAKTILLRDPKGNPVKVTADGTFIEMALVPNSSMVANLVKLDEQGRIIVDCANRTSLPGIFAAGDVTSMYAEQVLIAVGEGAKAALSAYDYLLPKL